MWMDCLLKIKIWNLKDEIPTQIGIHKEPSLSCQGPGWCFQMTAPSIRWLHSYAMEGCYQEHQGPKNRALSLLSVLKLVCSLSAGVEVPPTVCLSSFPPLLLSQQCPSLPQLRLVSTISISLPDSRPEIPMARSTWCITQDFSRKQMVHQNWDNSRRVYLQRDCLQRFGDRETIGS